MAAPCRLAGQVLPESARVSRAGLGRPLSNHCQSVHLHECSMQSLLHLCHVSPRCCHAAGAGPQGQVCWRRSGQDGCVGVERHPRRPGRAPGLLLHPGWVLVRVPVRLPRPLLLSCHLPSCWQPRWQTPEMAGWHAVGLLGCTRQSLWEHCKRSWQPLPFYRRPTQPSLPLDYNEPAIRRQLLSVPH